MKKLIAGFVMAIVASPTVQAWTGGIEDMRTMEANERGPIVRVKSHRVQTACGVCRVAHRPVRHAYQPQRYAQQVVRRSAPRANPARPTYNQTQRVVSEKIYVQKVHRYPAATCPIR